VAYSVIVGVVSFQLRRRPGILLLCVMRFSGIVDCIFQKCQSLTLSDAMPHVRVVDLFLIPGKNRALATGRHKIHITLLTNSGVVTYFYRCVATHCSLLNENAVVGKWRS